MADSPLPPLYARWARDVVPEAIPPEPKATCHDCAMCVKDGEPPVASYAFRPDTKCCTYVPDIPNFLVGAVLADDDPAMEHGRSTMRERIAQGVAVTPLGVHTPPTKKMVWDRGMNLAGRSTAVRCPHYRVDEGTCGIWRHRNAVCATWFCKHERGAKGQRFWLILRELLQAVEQSLARWCLLQLDVEVGRIPAEKLSLGPDRSQGHLTAAEADERKDPAAHAQMWGAWAGREEELYRACAQQVEGLTWAEVLDISGPDVQVFVKMVREAWDALQQEGIPRWLRLGAFQSIAVGEQATYAVTYSPFDPIALPSLLISALHYFDGRSTPEVFKALADERGLQIDEKLLRALLDWGVLVPSAPPATAAQGPAGTPVMPDEDPGLAPGGSGPVRAVVPNSPDPPGGRDPGD